MKGPLQRRGEYLVRKYGITLFQYERLLKGQGGGCAICDKTPEEEGKSLAVDHDHVSMEIRGVLCSFCNHRLVGRLRDSDLLRRVADYLDTHTGWFVPVKRKKRKPRAKSRTRRRKT